MRERGEQRRFHPVAGQGLLGFQLESQQPLALERQAHQDRATLGHAAARAHSLNDQHSRSLDPDRDRQIEVQAALRGSHRLDLSLAEGEIRQPRISIVIVPRFRRPEEPAGARQPDRHAPRLERDAQPLGGDVEERVRQGIGDEGPGQLSQAREIRALGLHETQALAGRRGQLPDQEAGDQEDDERRGVLPIVDPEGVERGKDEVVQAESREQRRENSRAALPEPRGEKDREEQEQGDRGVGQSRKEFQATRGPIRRARPIPANRHQGFGPSRPTGTILVIPHGLRGALHGDSFGFLSNFFRPRLPDFRRGTPQSRNGRGRRAPARSGPRRPADQPDPAQPSGRETARSARSARVSPRVSGRVSRLGRTRRRRTLLFGIRPGGGLSSPRRPPVPGGVPRCDDCRDGLRHLVCIQPVDRALPGRRRGLPGRHEAARTARGRRVRMRPDRGLRTDDHGLRRDRVRRGLQFSARRLGEPEARGGGFRPRPPGRPEPPRCQRVRHVPSSDLPRLRRDACPHDRLRPLHPRLRASGGSSGAAAEGRRTASALGLLPTLFILLRAYSWAAARTPASRLSRTECRFFGSPGWPTRRRPCCTWPSRWRSRPGAFCSVIS